MAWVLAEAECLEGNRARLDATAIANSINLQPDRLFGTRAKSPLHHLPRDAILPGRQVVLDALQERLTGRQRAAAVAPAEQVYARRMTESSYLACPLPQGNSHACTSLLAVSKAVLRSLRDSAFAASQPIFA